jgi:hypothetical protein
MKVVEWDIGLARLAQRWAESGIYAHDCPSCRRLPNNRSISVGQNGFMSIGLSPGKGFWESAFNGWYSEIKDFTYGTESES